MKVKFQLGYKSIPRLTIEPAKSNENKTAGICGVWDGSQDREFFVLDKNGAKIYLDTTSEDVQFIDSIKDFWRFF